MAASVPPDSLQSEETPSLVSQETNAEKRDYNSKYWHLKFREFSPSEGSDPIQDLKRMSELCFMWLRPDLHSKEEILDQLVLEKFMISVGPELQAIAIENGVKSCKELEKLLRSGGKPRQWSIIHSQGQMYLFRHPGTEDAADVKNGWGDMRWSAEYPSESEEPPNRGQARPELQNLLETEEPSTSQEEEVFLETVPGSREPDYLRPEWNQGSDLVQDWYRTWYSDLFLPQDPQPTQDPDPLQAEAASVMLRGDTNMYAAIPVTRVLANRDAAVNTGLQRLSSSRADSLPTPQGRASCVGNTEDGQLAVATLRPEESVVHLAGRVPFGCHQCNKSFRYKSQFILHQRTHTGERPFRCHLCEKGFLQSSDLRVHQRIHTGEKPYGCSICNKVFTHESSLLDHIRTHTKEMPYVCESCGKRFNHKGNLKVHMDIHSNARPYKCMECNAVFRQKGTLMRHMKTHSKEVPSREAEGDSC
ncbi:zinc finger and SCAN domain-containing protein 5B-like [Microtus oregoni]|uniref:zinc finger and SCAN domain-containing protein 5B-like n=1 Tax=Microtus oregoni TaxID=111838 RepID=UPI001BB20467|nr:zinc finger and SCAN domain-containing protein 5B-like [Microtus oregoni]